MADRPNTSTPLSNAEEIRRKRLAKLQSASTSAATPPSTAGPTSTQTTPTTPKPAVKAPVVSASPPASKPSSTSSAASPRTTTSTTPRPPKPFPEWHDDMLSRVLQVTLRSQVAAAYGNYILLEELVQELKEESVPEPFLMDKDMVDRVLLARLSLPPEALVGKAVPGPIFYYLLGCWRRVMDIRTGTLRRASHLAKEVLDQRLSALDHVRHLIVSYMNITLQMPDTFPQPGSLDQLGPNMLAPLLLNDVDSENGIPDELIKDMVERFEQDELEGLFGPIIKSLGARAREVNILGEYRKPLDGLMRLLEHKQLVELLHLLPNWNPANLPARTIEFATLLGPFFRCSIFPTDVPKLCDVYFKNTYPHPRTDIQSSINSLRGAIRHYRSALAGIIDKLVRVSSASRQDTLRWMADTVRANEKRAGMQVDPNTVATDGFMTNILHVLLALCEPFMDINYTKIDRIDGDYYRKPGALMNVAEETKINADKEASDAFYGITLDGMAEPNFISHVFYLTAKYMHYGLRRCMSLYDNLLRATDDLYRRIEQFNEAVAANPAMGADPLTQEVTRRCKDRMNQLMGQKWAMDAALLDPGTLQTYIRFATLVMNWLIRQADPTKSYPAKMIELPLPETPPEGFVMLPEYLIEDAIELYIFSLKYYPKLFSTVPLDQMVIFALTFLTSSKYIKNPYLKASLVEALFFVTVSFQRESLGNPASILRIHPLAIQHLVPAMMRFYIEVEHTGVSSQFYDKFNIRYHISQIMKYIWSDENHRQRLREETKNIDLFVRFVNLLMNDTTYLLDESLSKLAEIHNIQTEMANTEAWQNRPQEERNEREAQLQQYERQASSYVSLSNETVNMLRYMTEEVQVPFLAPEIVDRLAAMLNYTLLSLVGPKCTELKVQNPKKYHFQPRVLLSDIVSIYLNLNHDEFLQAVAREGRSYRPELFTKAANVLSKYGLKPEEDIQRLYKFLERVEAFRQADIDEEAELGDVPDEFLDPITYTLMRDPVILPTSGVTMDLSAIKQHLLSDASDPFNRMPLTVDMLQPNTELKAKIDAFIAEKRAKR